MPPFIEAIAGSLFFGMLTYAGSSIITISTQGGIVGQATKNTYVLCALVGFFFYGVIKHSGG